MITANQLHRTFNVSGQQVIAVNNVSFNAEDGAVTGLLGSNGAGKSTTLRMLATLLKPDRGSATIDGSDIATDPTGVRRNIGFMPHNAGIYPRLTAIENIAYYARICGMRKPDIQPRIDTLIQLLDMQGFAERRTAGFSQGQKTKVGLARALVHRPRTLLLDEPTNGLDVMATRGLRTIIRRLADEGHCVVFSSHIMQEIEALCDHVAIIADGCSVHQGTLATLLQESGEHSLEDAFVWAISRQQENRVPNEIAS